MSTHHLPTYSMTYLRPCSGIADNANPQTLTEQVIRILKGVRVDGVYEGEAVCHDVYFWGSRSTAP